LDADVAIVGAGIGGLATALSLHAHGLRVRVVESVPEVRPLGVGTATREAAASATSRSPRGFARLEDVVGADELRAIADRYKSVAGFSVNELNSRASLAEKTV
jgi:2-polyprenyl-6-methoxyphenol hydroxylase-like FAD-dependent oxidoreductase